MGKARQDYMPSGLPTLMEEIRSLELQPYFLLSFDFNIVPGRVKTSFMSQMTEPFGSIWINRISKNTSKLLNEKNYSKSIHVYNRTTKLERSQIMTNADDCRNIFPLSCMQFWTWCFQVFLPSYYLIKSHEQSFAHLFSFHWRNQCY